jgi:hypothetical protein
MEIQMGDRCNCNLTIGGVLKKEHIPLLTNELIDFDPEDLPNDLAGATKEIANGLNYFSFSRVNYGELPSELRNILHKLKLSYIWSCDAGDSYGPMNTYFDARTGETRDYNALDGEIVLTLEQIEKEGAIEDAKRWAEFSRTLKFIVATSNHEILDLEKNGKLPEGYFAAITSLDVTP